MCFKWREYWKVWGELICLYIWIITTDIIRLGLHGLNQYELIQMGDTWPQCDAVLDKKDSMLLKWNLWMGGVWAAITGNIAVYVVLSKTACGMPPQMGACTACRKSQC